MIAPTDLITESGKKLLNFRQVALETGLNLKENIRRAFEKNRTVLCCKQQRFKNP